MDTLAAFAMGVANRDKESMVFDWDRAARRIRETGAQHAAAGLHSDWEYTGGDILAYGEIVAREDTYTFLASTWATPELELDGLREDCYRMQSEVPGWDSETYWPQSARAILAGKELEEAA